MSEILDRAAARFGRDRDLLPDASRPGPYETAYDVRRGYQQPLGPVSRRARAEGAVILFLGREEGEEDGLRGM
jgi:hypothetical protein